jgi:hypothetical protein
MLQYLVSEWPGATRAQDKDGYTPLKHLIERYAFQEQAAMIAFLVDADPASCSVADKWQFTPFYKFCLTWCRGRSEEDLHEQELLATKLLKAYPDAVRQRSSMLEESPLHAICRIPSRSKNKTVLIELLLKAYKEGASVMSSLGCLPIHCAVTSGTSVEVLKLLLDAYPKALCRRANVRRNLLVEAASSDLAAADMLKYLLKRSPNLVYTASGATRRLPLHTAASTGSCTFEKFKLLYEAYPEAVMIFDGDEYLPIHHALLKLAHRIVDPLSEAAAKIRFLLKQRPETVNLQPPQRAHSSLTAYQFSQMYSLDDYTVRLLLQACPEADPERAKKLNYAARRQLMFLAFAARTKIPQILLKGSTYSAAHASSSSVDGDGDGRRRGERDVRDAVGDAGRRTTGVAMTESVTSANFVYYLRRVMNIGDDMELLRHIASFL